MELSLLLKNNFSSYTEEYKIFAKEKDLCRDCSIYSIHNQVVQSEGNAINPTFMFIGESPGKEESEQGKPFIGRAGQKLREELRKYKDVFNKNTCLITNVIPCRPTKNIFPAANDNNFWLYNKENQTNGQSIVNHCFNKWLSKEIKILKPKVIITLGSQVLNCIQKIKGITDNRGTWKFIEKLNIWTFATFHPSYVLRCENDKTKQDVAINFQNDFRKIANTWQNITNSLNPIDDHRIYKALSK